MAIPAILLIRHAQASFGAVDYDVVSDLGSQQVQALVGEFRRRGVQAERVVSGDLRRQHDTAVPIAELLSAELSVDARFNEYDDRAILTNHATIPAGLEHHAGDVQLSSRQFQEILDGALNAWIDAGADGPCGETWPAFASRVNGALREVADTLGKGETAVVVSSGGAIAAVCVALMGLPARALVAFNRVSVNTGISRIAVGRGGVTLVSVNEHAHLEQAGAGSLVTYR